eukprot:770885_1
MKIEGVRLYNEEYFRECTQNLEPFPEDELLQLIAELVHCRIRLNMKETSDGKIYEAQPEIASRLSRKDFPELHSRVHYLLGQSDAQSKVALLVYLRVFRKYITSSDGDHVPCPWRDPNANSQHVERFQIEPESSRNTVDLSDLYMDVEQFTIKNEERSDIANVSMSAAFGTASSPALGDSHSSVGSLALPVSPQIESILCSSSDIDPEVSLRNRNVQSPSSTSEPSSFQMQPSHSGGISRNSLKRRADTLLEATSSCRRKVDCTDGSSKSCTQCDKLISDVFVLRARVHSEKVRAIGAQKCAEHWEETCMLMKKKLIDVSDRHSKEMDRTQNIHSSETERKQIQTELQRFQVEIERLTTLNERLVTENERLNTDKERVSAPNGSHDNGDLCTENILLHIENDRLHIGNRSSSESAANDTETNRLNAKLQNLSSVIKQLKSEKLELERNSVRRDREDKRLMAKNCTLQASNTRLKIEKKKLLDSNSKLSSENAKTNSKAAALQTQNNLLSSELNRCNAEIEEMRRLQVNRKEEIVSLKNRIENLSNPHMSPNQQVQFPQKLERPSHRILNLICPVDHVRHQVHLNRRFLVLSGHPRKPRLPSNSSQNTGFRTNIC